MSIWTSFVKIWMVSNYEFNATFLTFWGSYRLIFDLETIEVSWMILQWLIFEKKPKSIKAGNLNSRLSFLITTVCIIWISLPRMGNRIRDTETSQMPSRWPVYLLSGVQFSRAGGPVLINVHWQNYLVNFDS